MAKLKNGTTIGGSTAWHAGNDGSGSGLDADLLDGQQGSYYTGYTDTAIANLVDSSPATLDTLNELAAALGDDPNFATTVTNSIATKLNSSAYTASDVLTKIKTVDGSGSGLDADTVDGTQLSAITHSGDSVALTGDVTGSTTVASDGSISIATTVANDSHSHSNYIAKNVGYEWTGTGGNALSFRSLDTIDTASGDQAALEVYQDTPGADAFMQFHVGGDYAKYFGLHGGINDFVIGGWSYGAGYQRIFHDGYHPNADKWTTARTHTVTLTGEVTGTASQSVDGTGNRTWNISTTIAAPASPSITSTQVIGETIELIFTPSSTSNIDLYEVWSDSATGIFSLIASIPPQDFGSSMSVIDNTFEVGTVNYRVYAIKGGNYSTPATTSRAFSAPTLDVTNLAVIPTVQTFEVGYDIPDSRFVDHVEIYVDIEAVQGNLSRTGATLVYSGLRDNFTYNVSAANKDNYHQFWVEVVQ